jgi:hypothetical protein
MYFSIKNAKSPTKPEVALSPTCAPTFEVPSEVERRSGTRPAAYVLLYQYRSARWSAIYAGD